MCTFVHDQRHVFLKTGRPHTESMHFAKCYARCVVVFIVENYFVRAIWKQLNLNCSTNLRPGLFLVQIIMVDKVLQHLSIHKQPALVSESWCFQEAVNTVTTTEGPPLNLSDWIISHAKKKKKSQVSSTVFTDYVYIEVTEQKQKWNK